MDASLFESAADAGLAAGEPAAVEDGLAAFEDEDLVFVGGGQGVGLAGGGGAEGDEAEVMGGAGEDFFDLAEGQVAVGVVSSERDAGPSPGLIIWNALFIQPLSNLPVRSKLID